MQHPPRCGKISAVAPASKKRLDPRLHRFVDQLLALLREKGFSMAEAERRTGMSSKYLYKVLHGYQDLKVKHVLDVLEAIGVPQEEFWARLAEKPRRSLLPELSLDELTVHVEEIVQRVLKGKGDDGEDPPGESDE